MRNFDAIHNDRTISRRLKITVLLLGIATVAILAVNAHRMAICEDEANGYYVARRPLGEMLALLQANIHEDPPLADIVLHGWIRVAGFEPWRLRSLPIVFFLLMIPGLFLVARRLGGRRGAWFSLAAVFLMPYHWTIPAAFRWYSLFACLAVWNFFFFLRMEESARQPDEDPPSRKTRFARAIPYVVTGACLWYTNYSAPVFFFVHLIVALCRAKRRRQVLVDLTLCYAAIFLLFCPWVPTLLRQLDISIRSRTPGYAGLALYVLFAGEFSTPFHYWISLPAALASLLLAVLVLAQFRRCWIPALVCVVILLGLLQTGAIGPKRLLIVSPFVAITAGLALGRGEHRLRRLRVARTGLIAAALMVAAGSSVHFVRREGWIALRWLDPTAAVVRRIRSESPETLILANSNPVFFYLEDEYGRNLCRGPQELDADYRPQALLFPQDRNYGPLCEELLAKADRVAWVYHSPYGGPISKWRDAMVEQMGRLGFRVAKTEGHLRASADFLEYHPKFQDRTSDPLDEHRIVVMHFTKSPAEERSSRPRKTAPVVGRYGPVEIEPSSGVPPEASSSSAYARMVCQTMSRRAFSASINR